MRRLIARWSKARWNGERSVRASGARPKNNVGAVERLESRCLLYAVSGAAWPHPELITVSFMPDGTDVAGVPSSLFATMNAKWATATWQKEMLRGLQSYAANANINVSVVADDGSAFGSAGSHTVDNNKQGDQDFGDVRIGAFNLGTALGQSDLPPDVNVDTTAGDFFLNSTTGWNIGSSTDLYTVSAHEEGHSLGLCHSTVTTAVMYDTYNGVKSNLTSDDISGIQAIYGVRPKDSFDAAASNDTRATATNINSYIDGNKQITLNNLDITTTADQDWYKLTIPSGSASTMTVKMQSTSLSLLAPKLALYNSSGTLLSSVTGGYNSTVTLTRTISAGQVYYVQADGADTTVFGTGKYSLQVNMGSASLPAVPVPNTATPAGGTPIVGCDASLDHRSDGDRAGSDRFTADVSSHAASTLSSDDVIVATPGSFDAGSAAERSSAADLADHASGGEDKLASIQLAVGQDAIAGESVVMSPSMFAPAAEQPRDTAAVVDHLLSAGLLDCLRPGIALAGDVSGDATTGSDGAGE